MDMIEGDKAANEILLSNDFKTLKRIAANEKDNTVFS